MLRARRPFPDTPEEIVAMSQYVKDPNFRIQISRDGIHAYNRDGFRSAQDPYAFWPQLGLENDASHAFYMGVELARAHHAWLLGKRYEQDEDLNWSAALPPADENKLKQKAEGLTLTHQLREKLPNGIESRNEVDAFSSAENPVLPSSNNERAP